MCWWSWVPSLHRAQWATSPSPCRNPSFLWRLYPFVSCIKELTSSPKVRSARSNFLRSSLIIRCPTWIRGTLPGSPPICTRIFLYREPRQEEWEQECCSEWFSASCWCHCCNPIFNVRFRVVEYSADLALFTCSFTFLKMGYVATFHHLAMFQGSLCVVHCWGLEAIRCKTESYGNSRAS